MNAKYIALGGWIACVLAYNTLADSATQPELWHASQANLAASYSTASGNGLYVRVGGFSSDVLLSQDGTRWACHNSGIQNSLYSVAFGRGRFVAVGNEGALITSTDGRNWKSLKSRTDDRLRSITFAKGLFVAVGYNGTVITSDDGLVWSKRNSRTDDRLHSVAFGNDRFLAMSKNGNVVSSTDGKHWKLTAQLNGIFANVAYENGSFASLSASGTTFVSVDGETWVSATSNTELVSVK